MGFVMKAVKVYSNNSISMVFPDGREAVLIGSGIGFGKRPGDEIDARRIEKTYYIQDELQTKFLQLLKDTRPETVQVSEDILEHARQCGLELKNQLIISLTDHISFAIERYAQGIELPYADELFCKIKSEPYDKSIEQKIRQQEANHNRKKQAAEKKIKAAQYKQQRYEDEVLKCLEGESAFSQEMLARLIAQAEAEVRQAKGEYATLLQNNDDRTTVQQIRSYYDEFLGEFDLATVQRKRAILAQLFEKVEVGKGYKITIHVRGTYKQFLGEEQHGKF